MIKKKHNLLLKTSDPVVGFRMCFITIYFWFWIQHKTESKLVSLVPVFHTMLGLFTLPSWWGDIDVSFLSVSFGCPCLFSLKVGSTYDTCAHVTVSILNINKTSRKHDRAQSEALRGLLWQPPTILVSTLCSTTWSRGGGAFWVASINTRGLSCQWKQSEPSVLFHW